MRRSGVDHHLPHPLSVRDPGAHFVTTLEAGRPSTAAALLVLRALLVGAGVILSSVSGLIQMLFSSSLLIVNFCVDQESSLISYFLLLSLGREFIYTLTIRGVSFCFSFLLITLIQWR